MQPNPIKPQVQQPQRPRHVPLAALPLVLHPSTRVAHTSATKHRCHSQSVSQPTRQCWPFVQRVLQALQHPARPKLRQRLHIRSLRLQHRPLYQLQLAAADCLAQQVALRLMTLAVHGYAKKLRCRMMSARRQTGRENSPRARSAHHQQQSSEGKGRGLVSYRVALGRIL